MKVTELAEAMELETLCLPDEQAVIKAGYTSDLLSDVLANAPEECVLITIQAHKNAVAVAGVVGASAILFCNNRPVTEDMIEAARNEGIALLRTQTNQFLVSARAYRVLHGTLD
jgi:hypothetical protein